MAYPIFEIEVNQPLPDLFFSKTDTGFAVLLRKNGRAVHFWMEPRPANNKISAAELSRRIAEQAKDKLLSENIRDELWPSAEKSGFPSLTVAICTKDRPEFLYRCLKSLSMLEPEAPGESKTPEILVVDNAPADSRTEDLARSTPAVRYVCEPKPGLNFARNRVLQEATGELIAFLDDDVTVDPLWLQGLKEAWAENTDAAAFTGLVLPRELATEAQIIFEWGGGFRRGFEKIRYCGQSLEGNPLYPCGAGIFGAGANMAFRKDILTELGGFDQVLDTGRPLPGGGDLDIFYRVIRAGYPLVYEPQYLVFHQHRRDIDELRRQYRSWGLGFMAFVTKSYKTDPCQRQKFRRLVLWWFKYQLVQLRRSLRKSSAVPPSMVLAELKGGVVGLFGEYSRSAKRIDSINRLFK